MKLIENNFKLIYYLRMTANLTKPEKPQYSNDANTNYKSFSLARDHRNI